jgi:large subunit ribosomal protein L10
MKKEDKGLVIETLSEQIKASTVLYLADISGLNAAQTSELRRTCFNKGIKLEVVKNTLLRKAMESVGNNYEGLYNALKGNTALMITDQAKTPAVLIKEFAKKNKLGRPELKGAYVEETCYLGANNLEFLINIKSKNELIGEVVGILQSPAKNVISALQSGGGKIAGIVKTLSERPQ